MGTTLLKINRFRLTVTAERPPPSETEPAAPEDKLPDKVKINFESMLAAGLIEGWQALPTRNQSRNFASVDIERRCFTLDLVSPKPHGLIQRVQRRVIVSLF